MMSCLASARLVVLEEFEGADWGCSIFVASGVVGRILSNVVGQADSGKECVFGHLLEIINVMPNISLYKTLTILLTVVNSLWHRL